MLPGIRQRCRWSKLQRVSPCWTASNPPHSHWWGWGGCWCFAREQSVFYSMTPLKVEPFTDFAGEEQPWSSSYPYHPPKASRGQSTCRVWWTASGWSWLPPPTETGTATALPCSLSPNISECAGRHSEPWHISGTLSSLAHCKAKVFPQHISFCI